MQAFANSKASFKPIATGADELKELKRSLKRSQARVEHELEVQQENGATSSKSRKSVSKGKGGSAARKSASLGIHDDGYDTDDVLELEVPGFWAHGGTSFAKKKSFNEAPVDASDSLIAPIVNYNVVMRAEMPVFLSKRQQELLDKYPQDVVAKKAVEYFDQRSETAVTTAEDIKAEFAYLTPVGAGVYGVVLKGCIQRPGSMASSCITFPIDGESESVIMPVIVKLAWQKPDVTENGNPTWALTLDNLWVGSCNTTREAVLGVKLADLVARDISPHFMTLYHSTNIASPPSTMAQVFAVLGKESEYIQLMEKKSNGKYAHKQQKPRTKLMMICMEECVATLGNFMKTEVKAHARPGDVIKSLLVQVCAALVAMETQLGMRHNDLHDANVLVTSTQEDYYHYKIGSKYYRVPTFGVCCKIADYGMSTCRDFGELDTAYMCGLSDGGVTWGVLSGCNPLHAVELYDYSRILEAVLYRCRKCNVDASTIREVTEMFDMPAVQLSETLGEKFNAGYHTRFTSAFAAAARASPEKLTAYIHVIDDMSKSHGLIERLFHRVASSYQVTAADASGASHLYESHKGM